ncbi:MAG: glycosyltransferase [Candidatus Electrothrix scaldis]|nr:MAG: glycosyltransferase [Candidatus Electrothrix sp. GW3-3]
MIELAIIIPYYKITYLDHLLCQLSRQTNKKFRLYIGDDFSPDSPHDTIKKYNKFLDIEYKRFSPNLGGDNLVSHWNRCLEMLQDETWVWMLPDDDLPSPNCVEEFYKILYKIKKSDEVNTFNIPLRIINSEGEIVKKDAISPFYQDNYEFYLSILKSERGISLGDNIFRKKILINSGGFVSFPKGWGSDHATILNVSASKKICCLQNAWFGFRQSGINISSQVDDGDQKMKARFFLAQWLKRNENIFPQKPSLEFYRYFYWKGEYYFLYEWDLTVSVFYNLIRLRLVCLKNINPFSLVNLLIQKILLKCSR